MFTPDGTTVRSHYMRLLDVTSAKRQETDEAVVMIWSEDADGDTLRTTYTLDEAEELIEKLRAAIDVFDDEDDAE